MKLARFTTQGTTRLGRIDGDQVIDLSKLGHGASMRALLDACAGDLSAVAAVKGPAFPLDQVTLEVPIDDPQKFLALGMNYADHVAGAAGQGFTAPDSQTWFSKQVSCLNGPTGDIVIPRVSDEVDYEGELVVIIGERCRYVPREDALGVIAGFAVGNDVSVRDWQKRSPTFMLGKGFDTHGPVGPWITTLDEVPDPQMLSIRTWVNDELKQDDTTDQMIHKVADQIAYISQAFTLMPGDVIMTGTPAGTGMERGTYLKAGDVVRIEIDGLGTLENHVVKEA